MIWRMSIANIQIFIISLQTEAISLAFVALDCLGERKLDKTSLFDISCVMISCKIHFLFLCFSHLHNGKTQFSGFYIYKVSQNVSAVKIGQFSEQKDPHMWADKYYNSPQLSPN